MSQAFPSQFPYDVVCVIISWLATIDRPSLKNVALTNKALREEAESCLWQQVTLKCSSWPRDASVEDKIRVLTSNPTRPKRIVDLRLQLTEAEAPEHRSFWESLNSSVERLLVQTTRLKRLYIEDFLFTEKQAANSTLCFTTRGMRDFQFRLTDFELQTFSMSPAWIWDFITLQPTIRRLALHSYIVSDTIGSPRDTIPLSADALPELEVVYAPLDYLPRIVRARPVRYVAVDIEAEQTLDALCEALSASSRPITALSVGLDGDKSIDSFLRRLPHLAPQLRFFSCDWSDSEWPNSNASAVKSLRFMPALEVIRWRGEVKPDALDPMGCNSNPLVYAGPSLRVVQHESHSYPYDGDDMYFEGVWERQEDRSAMWQLASNRLFVPPLRDRPGLLDPYLALQIE